MLTALLFFPIFALIGFVFYFLPTMIAAQRRHHNTLGVFLLNFFLGWSVIGWIIALIWAFAAPPVVMMPQGAYGAPPVATLCPNCGVPLRPGATFCSNCGARV